MSSEIVSFLSALHIIFWKKAWLGCSAVWRKGERNFSMLSRLPLRSAVLLEGTSCNCHGQDTCAYAGGNNWSRCNRAILVQRWRFIKITMKQIIWSFDIREWINWLLHVAHNNGKFSLTVLHSQWRAVSILNVAFYFESCFWNNLKGTWNEILYFIVERFFWYYRAEISSRIYENLHLILSNMWKILMDKSRIWLHCVPYCWEGSHIHCLASLLD